MPQLLSGDREILASETGKRWFDNLTSGDADVVFDTAMEIVGKLSDDVAPIESGKAVRNAWREYTALADQFNDPGVFSTLIGYEWTSLGDDNIHRNVIFRGGAGEANHSVPFSQYDTKNPEDLWAHLAAFEEDTGGDVLAIPHNGNLSNGRMFAVTAFDGSPLTKELAELRAEFEPLYEATQIKGDSEAHPLLSPQDEFADFDTWDAGNLIGSVAKTPDMLPAEYAREALKTGLALEASLGVNQFKFGMVGGTDAHTGLSAVEEEISSASTPVWNRDRTGGSTSLSRPLFRNYRSSDGNKQRPGVWSTENTREAIFVAMERKEVYATTGSRILVRLFGGYDFSENDTLSRLPADVGYAKGVPMGGDLRPADGKTPNFLVAALKDPFSGNLDRIQIIKGWLEGGGRTREKVYDVVWSDNRTVGADGKLPSVGNTVDVENATWRNSIGSAELIGFWSDPDFDPDQRAFYYARVIEIPTPRWTAYEAERFDVEMDPEVPMITTERA